jgi:6-pyruvoyltetrahydropterin/6-carboxytetrahydropterin synthase
LHFVEKSYGHDLGLSACFRQWRARSHCRFLHGYPLAFRFRFGATELDENGWVIDFGSLKPLKQYLCDTFDHKLLVARDDPDSSFLVLLGRETDEEFDDHPSHGRLADVLVVEAVGCEAFARMAWNAAHHVLGDVLLTIEPRVKLIEVEVREHGANGVIYTGEN